MVKVFEIRPEWLYRIDLIRDGKKFSLEMTRDDMLDLLEKMKLWNNWQMDKE